MKINKVFEGRYKKYEDVIEKNIEIDRRRYKI